MIKNPNLKFYIMCILPHLKNKFKFNIQRIENHD